jgi:hypothetical protein
LPMSLTIELTPPIEMRVKVEAEKAGVTPAEYVSEWLDKTLPVGRIDAEEQKRLNQPSIDLMEEWLEQARRPRTPEEEADAEASMLELMRNLNATRRESGERLPFPDVE